MHSLTFHGGRLDEAATAFPDAPRPWLDLSTGINPFAWDGAVPPVDLRALPSVTALAGLERAAAAAFGVPDASVAVLPGTEIGLRLLGHLGLPAPFRYIAPGYRTHGEALARAMAISVEAIDEAAGQGGTLLLANPNNPDGRLLPLERLLALARRLGTRGGVLVVDEAFIEATPEASLLPHLRADDPVLVFRSFGKYFGLAGVRLGFACGAPTLVARMRALLGSWPVSATAIAVGTAAYRDSWWIDGMREGVAGAAAALDRVLASHALTPLGGCPLFRLVETDAAAVLFDRLARVGILTRPFEYNPRWLRFGLPGDAAALSRLNEALGHR
ncbi:aminotransferase class I/II-fold pyridoxal phosphate-dependent enzyme [Sphingomonas solaris]|uniref:aminotransferase class I/II-fold pyridoxal phosphate-dependent enzyme n=1 Tax=Alterirhizorhabdus solaris TaxID=2529389 RepID=UPI003B83899C